MRALILQGCCALLIAVGAIEFAAAQTQPKQARNVVQTLDHGWQFRQISAEPQDAGTDWMPATVPGDVHLDLLANKKISDPFYRDNESKLQWIEKESWEYRDSFDVAPTLLARSNFDLVFDGLDGPCTVFLNDAEVLKGINSFRIWRVPVKDHLHAGQNTLRVVFESPITAAERMAAADPWAAKTKVEGKTYLRKPAYEYGWDWGPRFVTSGIWRSARLEAWDKARIADFSIRQRDVSKDVAHLDAQLEIEAASAGPAQVNIQYVIGGKQATFGTTADLHPGNNLIDIPMEIRNPKLWFPAGYGDQPLYEFTARLGAAGTLATIEERKVKIGLRSVVLRRQLDQWGRSFEFVVNGIPVFGKGADVIPFDSFPNRVTTANYRRILESAKAANMNMIRHWGGGYYESDEFYSICDELGLMVWQDFMFGNDWQPGTYAFKQNIEAEAEDQVRRLRNHPSIVIWSGNNETEEALNWSPRDKLPLEVKYQMWQDYLTEFSGILNRVVARLNPETPYWPSSPSSDYEDLSDHYQSGDAHIWDVWHGRVPFSTYETHHPRFVTEYGFQSFPEMRTIEAFTEPEDRASIFTPVMLAHQKNNEGNSLIHDYMLKDYPEPKDFASLLYMSQVLQAEGIKIGAEHFRRSRPETMGSIYWQLNDCWPVASWSSIDYYGRWKALQFYARRFYAPILVSPHVENDSLKVYIVSDKTTAQEATLRVRLMDFDGKVLLEESPTVTVKPLSSEVYLTWPLSKLDAAGATDRSHVFVVADLSEKNGAPISRNLAYLAPTKQIQLKPATLTEHFAGYDGNPVVFGARPKDGYFMILISSPVLARDVYLSFGDLDVALSDNFVDILPGETVRITAATSAPLDALKSTMKVISLTDAFAPQPPSNAVAPPQ
ncbi:MAG TPA: glycoside hydrolase family 2 protein [Terracidiphilus sp.]|nr:glycoside hydrolase family 2 protein [Terracidiphilus sp.]